MTRNVKRKRKRPSRAPRDASTATLAMVGFFDLLGFSDRVENIDTPDDLRTIAGVVDSIRQRFEYRPTNRSTHDVQRILDKTVLAFSDCVVTAISLETEMVATEGHFDVLGSEIWEIAISQSRCTLDGHFLRGGIDIGLWYYDKAKDLLVSPAMVKAYKDERDRACYPVIAISDELYRLLRDHPLRKVYSKDIDPFPNQFSSFKHPKSGKRVRFINYLRLVAPSLDWQYDKATRDAYMALPRDSDERDRIMTDGYMHNLADFFERHKAVIMSAYGAAKDDVKEKYRFLAKYHNSELRRFLPKRDDLRISL
jgi:hypothetical protein